MHVQSKEMDNGMAGILDRRAVVRHRQRKVERGTLRVRRFKQRRWKDWRDREAVRGLTKMNSI